MIQQECEALANSHTLAAPCSLDLQTQAQRNNGGAKCLGLPSLPEPTEPPPPPSAGPGGVPVCAKNKKGNRKGRGLCDELITRPEESYRLWCVVVCDLETSRIGAPYIYMTLVA